MRYSPLLIALSLMLLLSGCSLSALNGREVLSALKGKVERKIHDAHHVEYTLTPNYSCDFSMGDSSILYHFMRSQNSNLKYTIEKISELRYRLCITNSGCIESLIESGAESVTIFFKSKEKPIIDLMPNPLLIADIFLCDSADESDRDIIIP